MLLTFFFFYCCFATALFARWVSGAWGFPRAFSTHLFGKGYMRFVGTLVIDTNAFRQMSGGKNPSRFDHGPFAMDPFRFNRIEPGALFGQETRQNAYSFAFLFDLLIVFTKPSADEFAGMPGGIIPKQQPCRFALGL